MRTLTPITLPADAVEDLEAVPKQQLDAAIAGVGGGSGGGRLLISDTHSTPLVFADLMQNEAGDDLLYEEA